MKETNLLSSAVSPAITFDHVVKKNYIVITPRLALKPTTNIKCITSIQKIDITIPNI